MLRNAKQRCRRYGLTYVETSELELRRRRYGKGFAYHDAEGRLVGDRAVTARIKQLAIPPAWTEVRIAANEKAHLQAIGRDAEGRLQYRYHPEWEKLRAHRKERRLLRLGASLRRVREAVDAAMKAPGLTRTKVIAAVVRLIDRAVLRPGYEEYTRKEGGRGAATLLKTDVEVEGDKVLLEFQGKGGKDIKREVEDPLLAGLVRKLAKLRGHRLFVAPDNNGMPRPVTAREVNDFIAEASGAPVSAKDFRTFRASAAALAFLAEQNGHDSEKLRKKAVVAAADQVSDTLANTRTVARSSYIHPAVIEAYEGGKLEVSVLRGRLRSGLTKAESALMRFLEGKAK
jgi:DNA topoisomerase-1